MTIFINFNAKKTLKYLKIKLNSSANFDLTHKLNLRCFK